MPLRFKCSNCRHLLSIARRKSGQSVKCPKCDRDIIVPEIDHPDFPMESMDRPTELDQEPVGVAAPSPAVNGPLKPLPSPRAAPNKAPTPPKPLPKRDPKSMPLFENPDLDRLIDPKAKSVPEQQPEPSAPRPAPPVLLPLPPSEAGFYVSRGSILIFAIAMFFMLLMAFMTGYILGT